MTSVNEPHLEGARAWKMCCDLHGGALLASGKEPWVSPYTEQDHKLTAWGLPSFLEACMAVIVLGGASCAPALLCSFVSCVHSSATDASFQMQTARGLRAPET